ncbi:hypothetical protein B0T20DRAFT_366109 [Sordaria brevicollis]|uniref:Uncharacterized protein n=1 Tax=Sordaria brevicollis TaxID=83679 RepID=A0AAE0NRE0_SORBR|nr:hypothetical protein B0T20DRAFT_366109 [Sordaria brevicollis]
MAYTPRKALGLSLTFLVLLLGIFPQPTRAVQRYDESQCCLQAKQDEQFTWTVTKDPVTGMNLSSEAPICGQVYNDNILPAPELKVTYAYCKNNCGGFGLSKGDEPGQWAAPIVQFLLPSVIFSMNVPRRHILLSNSRFKDWVWRTLPLPLAGKRRKAVEILVKIILQALDTLFGGLDVLLWIVVIMGMAGPMMVGGLHEAVLDHKIVKALEEGVHRDQDMARKPPTLKSLRITVEVLVTAISGNLVMGEKGGYPEVEIKKALLASFPGADSEVIDHHSSTSSREPSPSGPLLPPLPFQAQVTPPTRANTGGTTIQPSHSLQPSPDISLQPLDEGASKKLREQLTRLISSQLNFAATIGAPVVFYLGAFIYTILDIRNMPSDQDAAISLAFGVEWMIIVHVAIIGGCLLASNNPSPVDLLVGKEAPKERISAKRIKWLYFTRKNAYDGVFQPVNMWKRGINKSKWLRESEVYQNNERFRERVKIKKREYFFLIALQAFILITLPPAAGAFVAWLTPPIGWSCRSLSFVTYSGSQFLQTLTYFIYLYLWERDQERHRRNQVQDQEFGQCVSSTRAPITHHMRQESVVDNRPTQQPLEAYTPSFGSRTLSMGTEVDDEEDIGCGRYDMEVELKEIHTRTQLLSEPSTPSPGPSRSSRQTDESRSSNPNRTHRGRLNSSSSTNLDRTPSPRPSMALLKSKTIQTPPAHTSSTWSKPPKSLPTHLFQTLSTLLFLLSLFLSIGTTLMQIMGVYRNCFCYITVAYWFNTNTSHPNPAMVNVASDTWYQRNSSYNWMVMGGVATAFMAACAYAGWWFQGMIRRGLAEVVSREVWRGCESGDEGDGR